MTSVPLRFGPNSDQARSTAGGGTVLTNAYVEPTQGGKTAYSINSDPGLLLFSVVATGLAGRGVFQFGNVVYAVFGEYLYSVAVTGIATLVGSIPGSLPVNFSQNMKSPNNQITIIADSTKWSLENGVLTQITTANLPTGVHSSCQLNGFTLFGITDARVFSSNINDDLTVNALNFDTAQKYPDQGVRVFIVGEELWYWGTASLEVFRYIGGTGFPFQRMQGVGIGKGGGCAAKNSIVMMDNAPFLISDTLTVVRYQGYSPVRVSTPLVERDIAAAIKAGYADQITGFAFAMNGHQFYVLRCPLWCWVYDAMTSDWHNKNSYLSLTWTCGAYVFAFGKHLVQDATNGQIYELSLDAFDEAGQPLITKALSQNVNASPNGMICDCVAIDVQHGTGRVSITNDGIIPQIMLRVSRDGGKTFGPVMQKSTGQQGHWNKASRFNRLGRVPAAGMVIEVSLSSPVEKAIFAGFADVRALAI